ncbi:DUF4163 domain-containing protein [Aureisphaera galaxeae]|uniref:DUF3298 and DUF4163 domain-containing protein n=1 Tax=Aureisphaera galaxeae TaxID=1538023 RepID=UPI002350354C|nr:DUF3298 and DUF4163 domain-containing protein [Aureisphaera galaxeae]MDC8005337.1 DUF4163 domain-containing protein [Aureisphaera galaxeae]
MLKKSLSLLFICLLISCKSEPTLTFTPESFTEKELKICEEEPCSSVVVDFPRVSGDADLSKTINAEIEQWIAAVLFLGEDDVPTAKTLKSTAEDFILAYRDHQADLPTAIDTGGYEAEINIGITYESSEIISMMMDHFTYTGGAHGYGGISYLNLNSTTGKEIKTKDLFSDTKAITKLVEEAFRKEYDIPNDKSINDPGFWFENDTFYLPETVGFTANHMLVTYNPYDIAPYSEGIIQLKVPLENIDEHLNFNIE